MTTSFRFHLPVAVLIPLLVSQFPFTLKCAEGTELQTLHCPPCERIHCTPRKALKLQCNGGITTGVCGCCPVCAKTERETCGGKWDYLGKCDEGLVCTYEERQDTEINDQDFKGICQAVLDQPPEDEVCKPECTREFCHANPFEICSAKTLALERKACHGSCQHTACSSCFQIKQTQCNTGCHSTDLPCIRRFGRCVHHEFRDQEETVFQQVQHINEDGYFVCLIPNCPSKA